LKVENHWRSSVEWSGGKRSWRNSTQLKPAWRTRGDPRFVLTGACRTRTDKARRLAGKQREKGWRRTDGTSWLTGWIFIQLILWTQLFNSKLIFYFFTKIHKKNFSINRYLVYLIWTQKKNWFFYYLNFIIIFLFSV
jgi:hypothetical protein